MKTTLNIDDGIMLRLRQTAAEQDTTISALVEAALRMLFQQKGAILAVRPLPTFQGAQTFIDIADRDALYNLLDDGEQPLLAVADGAPTYGVKVKTTPKRRSRAKSK